MSWMSMEQIESLKRLNNQGGMAGSECPAINVWYLDSIMLKPLT